jgi:predicted GIY-YIG superfamily endonuclease
MIIYKITNLINNKVYIGQTIQTLEKRWSHHNKLDSNCYVLNRALKKYGKANFKIEKIAEASSREKLNKLEALYIKNYNCLSPNGYNLTTGGDSCVVSEQTRKKMSIAAKGIKNPFYGKKHSEEIKQKIKESRKLQDMSHKCKSIIDSNNNVYKSITEAAKTFKCSRASIQHILSGKAKSTKQGITFSYYKG